MNADFPGGLTGDLAAGHLFYDSNCAECHGLKGDGDGKRAYFMQRKPRDFTSDGARNELNRHFKKRARQPQGTGRTTIMKMVEDQPDPETVSVDSPRATEHASRSGVDGLSTQCLTVNPWSPS